MPVPFRFFGLLLLVGLTAAGCATARNTGRPPLKPPPCWIGLLPGIVFDVDGGESVAFSGGAEGGIILRRQSTMGVSLRLVWKLDRALVPEGSFTWEQARHNLYLAQRRLLEDERMMISAARTICRELGAGDAPGCPIASDLQSLFELINP